MSYYMWGDRISVGVESIDKDHKKMIFYLNEMHYAMTERNNNKEVLKNLENLIQHTKEHFKREEQEMLRTEYTLIEVHKREHELLLKEILRIQERFRNGKHVMNLIDLKCLKEWLENHIRDSDLLMASAANEFKRVKNWKPKPEIKLLLANCVTAMVVIQRTESFVKSLSSVIETIECGIEFSKKEQDVIFESFYQCGREIYLRAVTDLKDTCNYFSEEFKELTKDNNIYPLLLIIPGCNDKEILSDAVNVLSKSDGVDEHVIVFVGET